MHYPLLHSTRIDARFIFLSFLFSGRRRGAWNQWEKWTRWSSGQGKEEEQKKKPTRIQEGSKTRRAESNLRGHRITRRTMEKGVLVPLGVPCIVCACACVCVCGWGGEYCILVRSVVICEYLRYQGSAGVKGTKGSAGSDGSRVRQVTTPCCDLYSAAGYSEHLVFTC